MDYLCYGARVVISSFNLKNIMSEETNIPAVEEVVDAAADEVVAETAEAAPEAEMPIEAAPAEEVAA
jgi:hypothetical protein